MKKVDIKTFSIWSIALLGIFILSIAAVGPASAGSNHTPPGSLTLSRTPLLSLTPSVTSTGKGTPTPSATPYPTKDFSYGDLHMHTICSDGKGNYEDMVEQAIKSDLSFMAITDHRMNSAICREIRQKCRAEKRLLCLPGMEVSGRVHLLAIGIQRSIDASLPLATQVAEIHKQGGLAIAAHPFAPHWLYTQADFESGLDAIECPWEITTPPVNHLCVYDSDSHDIYVANMLKCAGKITSLADLKDALHARRCTRWDLDFPQAYPSPNRPSTTPDPK